MLVTERGIVSAASVLAQEGGRDKAVRGIGRNTIYQIGSQVAPAIAAMVPSRFLLRSLGYEAFGIVTIFSTTMVYFTMLDLGLGRAATRFIAQSLEAGRPDDLRRYFWGSITLLSGIGMIVMVSSVLSVDPRQLAFSRFRLPISPREASRFISFVRRFQSSR